MALKWRTLSQSYTDLTGKPELPPLWALGYHQCKWSIIQSNVKEITKIQGIKNTIDAIYWILITWKGLDVLHGTRNIFRIQKMVAG
jgi:hypothetical protein